MNYDILYKRTKTGAVQYYKVTVDEGDVDHAPIIVKESGQLGTSNPVLHRETIMEGKNIGKTNETTPLAQAKSQAFSDWNKKKDEGYKTYAEVMVGTTGGERFAYEGVTDPVRIKADLENCLPLFNTDANGQTKPMLAKDWNKGKGVKFPCYIQPKLDGVRCLMIVDEDGVKFLSRSGKEYTTFNHIATDIRKHVLNNVRKVYSFILDGEIYSDELTFQEIVAAVKKQRSDSLKLHFRAYDIVDPLMKQKDRTWEVKTLVDGIASPVIHFVDTRVVNDLLEVKTFHDEFVQAGYEGAMLRLYDGTYGQGQRSSHLLKVKEFDEAEFDFVQWEQGQRKEDLIAVCKHGAHTFRAKMVGSKEEKAKLDGFNVSKITIKHFGWTNDGLPRFPIGKAVRDYD